MTGAILGEDLGRRRGGAEHLGNPEVLLHKDLFDATLRCGHADERSQIASVISQSGH